MLSFKMMAKTEYEIQRWSWWVSYELLKLQHRNIRVNFYVIAFLFRAIEFIPINNYILYEENNIFAIENVPGTKFPYLRRLILELFSSYANETI